METRDLISAVHWYPADLGMVTFSTYSGQIRVWDLHSTQILGIINTLADHLQSVDMFAVRESVHAFEFSRLHSSSQRPLLALATSSGAQLFDFREARRVASMAPEPNALSKTVTALHWDEHQSDLILTGSY